MNCPNCGAGVPEGSTRCRKCGSAVEAQAPTGAAGGHQQPVQVIIQQGAAVPPAQVAPVAKAPPVGVPVKSKVAAGVLGILLGALGVHRFYLGYTAIGVAQLVLAAAGIVTCGMTTMAAWLWGLIEGILILAGSIDRDSQNRPLKD